MGQARTKRKSESSLEQNTRSLISFIYFLNAKFWEMCFKKNDTRSKTEINQMKMTPAWKMKSIITNKNDTSLKNEINHN